MPKIKEGRKEMAKQVQEVKGKYGHKRISLGREYEALMNDIGSRQRIKKTGYGV
ncbi:hypothetical protein [Paenibacillus thiaminolyticus]|uniref:hypothetical protein n=1 Tax=Paenibacillus thiaminolyticus TaxID=49283 RepID=UPI001600FD6D|nr:hypothetical protein [Paenibacillus thiaminolyticus]